MRTVDSSRRCQHVAFWNSFQMPALRRSLDTAVNEAVVDRDILSLSPYLSFFYRVWRVKIQIHCSTPSRDFFFKMCCEKKKYREEVQHGRMFRLLVMYANFSFVKQTGVFSLRRSCCCICCKHLAFGGTYCLFNSVPGGNLARIGNGLKLCDDKEKRGRERK